MSDLYMSDNISYEDVQNTISKVMDKVYRDGYNKAINDFIKASELYYLGVHPDDFYSRDNYEITKELKEIANKLKGCEV